MTTRTEMAHAEACCFDCGKRAPCRCRLKLTTNPSPRLRAAMEALEREAPPPADDADDVPAPVILCHCGSGLPVIAVTDAPGCETCFVAPAGPSTMPRGRRTVGASA